MADITVLFAAVSGCVQTLDEVRAVAERVHHALADTGHDEHVQHDVNGVGQLNADLAELRADNAHGVGDNVHRLALVRAGVQLGQLCVALLRIHPVVDVACVLFLTGADKGPAFHARHVVDCGAVQVAVRILLLVQLNQLAGRAGNAAQALCLFLAAVDPYNVLRLNHVSHRTDPILNVLVACHDRFSFIS